MEDQEIIQDFLIESNQNLSRVEQEILELEDRPGDQQILGSIFRSFHTVKGTCGFLGFGKLEAITHQAEHLLGKLRDGKKQFTGAMASLILDTLDSVQQELAAIETTGNESDISHTLLLLKLQRALQEEQEAAAPVAGRAEAAEEGKAGSLADQSIRVDTRLVDRLINLVGELVLVRNQVLQSGVSGGRGNDKAIAHRLNLITTELQEGVMRSRMQPVGTIWNKLPRLVRDTAALLKKEIRLVTDGANTEMDRTILEAVKDPLTHILRNSCDHGLETPPVREAAGKAPQGQVSLRAYHEGSQVVMEVADDGRGIDPARLRAKAVEKGILSATAAAAMSDREAVNLVFHPGFSTAEKVTNISGRGVGMDVVKKNIQSIGGQVEIESEVGKGTLVKIRIPLTLAIIPGLIVSCGGQTFVVPQAYLVELLRLQGDKQRAVEESREGSVLRWRGKLVPLVDLNEALRLRSGAEVAAGARNIAIVEAEGAVFGLMLDRIQATREIVVKPLGKQLKRMNWYAGATILGDGSVALILDVAGLARRERIRGRGERVAEEHGETEEAAKTEQFLLFACGRYNRVAVPLALVDRLERFPAEKLERTADSWVVPYREALLKVAALAKVLGSGEEECFNGRQVNVIVIRRGEQVTGLAVDRLLDVQQGVMAAPSETSAEGLLATFLLNGTATELIDLPRVLAAAQPTWDRPRWVLEGKGQGVLLLARTAFVSVSMRQYMELAGYRVKECEGDEAMWRELEAGKYGAVVAEWPEAGDGEWEERLRARCGAAGVAVIGVGEWAEEEGREWLLGRCAANDCPRLVELLGEARESR